MQASRFNIIGRIDTTGEYILVNLLSGHADILSSDEVSFLDAPKGDFLEKCIEKGYFVDPVQEELSYRMKHIDFLEARDNEEVQVFFVPTYDCNFDCTYCYQSSYHVEGRKLDRSVIDSFFIFLDTFLKGRRKYITLFGGEPLLAGTAYRNDIGYFVDTCRSLDISLSVVTNGYQLNDYIGILSKASIREIQITLDGIRDVHDNRRRHKGSKPSFDRISKNLEECLESGIAVNLRVVIDRENMKHLPALANFAIERGWTSNPLFKTQLGRNYSLHHCHSEPSLLYSRIEMARELSSLVRNHPEIIDFHRPAFSISRFLFDNGELPFPLFDACPACKSEWALDYTGRVFSCTATVGKRGEELGLFHPKIELDHKLVAAWQHRDVTTIEVCRSCSEQLACGGGCGSVAKNKNGDLYSPDCRPVKEIIGMGAGHYFYTH